MSDHGGKRIGAGRKAGALAKRTRDIAEQALATGETPLEYMLRVLRDPTTEASRRDAMAKAAAPYIHPSLSSIKHDGTMKVMRAELLSDDELASIAASGLHDANKPTADTSKLN